jgi:hypothetical protein
LRIGVVKQGHIVVPSDGGKTMKLLPRIAIFLLLASAGTALAFQRSPFRGFGQQGPYGSDQSEQSTEHTEFGWSRLRYDTAGYGGFRYGGGSWSRDYPKADRQFLLALRRLTRVDARSTEQVVDLNSDEIYNWPWVYAVQAQTWTFTEEQATRLRAYLNKGGFLMVDDFHGEADWQSFLNGMRLIFPDRAIEDLPNDDAIFHVLYDLQERFQIPGEQYVSTGRTYEKDGYIPRWRAIRDDKGRVMVAICFNMHLGDAWEWADDPRYPENFASLAFRIGIDYIMYGMTR